MVEVKAQMGNRPVPSAFVKACGPWKNSIYLEYLANVHNTLTSRKMGRNILNILE